MGDRRNDSDSPSRPANLARPPRLPAQVTVDLGCGRHPVPGTVGLDSVLQPGVGIVARLDAPHLPFAAGTVRAAYARNVLEHLDDLVAVMAEIWRVLAPNGLLHVEVPYFTSVSAYADPTHRRWFTYSTFDHFGPPAAQGWQANRHTWFARTRFKVTGRRLVFGQAHRLLGIAALANRFPVIYENLFAYWFPARALIVELSKIAAS